jgi:hypothetical protein
MAENLKVSKFNNGTTISNISDNSILLSNKKNAFCYYDNNQNATKLTVYRNVEKYVDDGCKTIIDLRENASIKMCFGNPEKEKV